MPGSLDDRSVLDAGGRAAGITSRYLRWRLLRAAASSMLAACTLWPSSAAASDEREPAPSGEIAAPVAGLHPGPAASSPAAETIGNGGVTFSGSLRARAESWGWFEAPPAEDDYTFGALVLRLALAQKGDHLDWKIEGMGPWLIHLPTDAVLPPPQGQLGLGATYQAANQGQDGSAVFRQGYVRFRGLFGDAASSLQLGRFEFSDGAEVMPADATLARIKRSRIAQRMIGPFGFSHVGRGFDGLRYSRQSGANDVTFVAARPTEGVFQLRSIREVDVDFLYGAVTRQLSWSAGKAEARLFALRYHDGRDVLKVDNRPMAARAADHREIRLTTVGGHAIAVLGGVAGRTDLLVWGAAQLGSWGELDHRASAIAAEGGYQWDAPWKPWVRAGYFRGSGDSDPNDGTHSTFFQVLPTPRIYARFPFFNLMNNEDLFGQVLLEPAGRLSIRGDIHYLRLSSRSDLWYMGGGAFQKDTFGYVPRPSNGNSRLGTLIDLSLDYGITASTHLTFYAGRVKGGTVESSIYPAGGAHPAAHLAYLEIVQRF